MELEKSLRDYLLTDPQVLQSRAQLYVSSYRRSHIYFAS
jgi:hypothetical protein